MKLSRHLPLILIILLAAFLRLWQLAHFPAGLNADEASLGYNAYSLLQTGRDEHGLSWPLSFRSFDDFKPGLYVYLLLPFIKILGLNVFAVRLPSALLGILTVWGTYLLVTKLFSRPRIALLSAFLLAISPWHLHFSRGAWEVNLACALLVFSLYFFLRGQKRPRFFLPSLILAALSLYAYHSMRLIAPLLFLALTIIYFPALKNQLRSIATAKPIIISLAIGLVILLPLIREFTSGSAASRFSGVSVFADQGPLWQALEMRRGHDNADSLPIRLLHNRYWSYFLRFSQNYLSHFSPRYLFITGDEIARSRVPNFGQSYLVLLPFFALGFLRLLQTLKHNSSKLILAWLLLSPLAAALTFQSPHALRSQNMVIPLTVITALGLSLSLSWLTNKKLKFLVPPYAAFLLLISSYNLAAYLHQYTIHYSQELPYAWQYGFTKLAAYLAQHQDKYDQIIISDRYDQPYILLAFFLKYPPAKLQQELVFSNRDNFGFSTGRAFGKFQFHRLNWDQDAQANTLLIVADESVPATATPIHTIYYPNHQPVFTLYHP